MDSWGLGGGEDMFVASVEGRERSRWQISQRGISLSS